MKWLRLWKNWHMILNKLFVCEALLSNHWQCFSECRPLSFLWIFKCRNAQRGNLDVPVFPSSKPSVWCLERVAIKCVSKFASSSKRSGLLIGMLFPRIDVNHVSKAWLTFSYMQTFTLYQLSDEILNGSSIFLHFFPCRLLPPHPLHLIMLFASPSPFFKQSSHIKMKIVNKHSLWMAIEPGQPVSESSTNISKFHAHTDSEHKFHKARIKNWPPIEFGLGFPWLRIRKHNQQLEAPWVGVPLLGTQSSTTETVQVFSSPTPGIQ